jgi:hypothetical protein
MRWTITKPSRPGYYWHREATAINDNRFPRICEIARVNGPHLLVYCGTMNPYRLDNASGEWSSEPIPEPKEGEHA